MGIQERMQVKLYSSFAIVVLALGSGQVSQIGSFESEDACKKALPSVLAAIGINDLWPNGFPSIAGPAPRARFENTLPQPISGYAAGACSVVGSNITDVDFWMDGVELLVHPPRETRLQWWCTLDTKKFADGRHTLAALVKFSDGTSEQLVQRYIVQNGTAPLPVETVPAVVVNAGCGPTS